MYASEAWWNRRLFVWNGTPFSRDTKMTVRKWCIVLVSIISGIFRPYFVAVDFTECSNESISQHRYSHVLMFMVETFIFNNGWGWRTFGAFGKPDATIEEIPNMYNVEWFQMVFAGNVLPLDLMQVVLCMCLCSCVWVCLCLRQVFGIRITAIQLRSLIDRVNCTDH